MESTGVKFFKSLKWKMSRSVIAAAAIVIVAVTAVAIPTAEQHIDDITEAYILDLASSKGETVERDIKHSGNAESVYKSEAAEILKDCKVKDMPSSYAYLVDKDGTMVYHPTAEKIGEPVENSVIKGVIADIGDGKKIKNKTVLYNFGGVKKYAGYYVPADKSFVLVVSCDYSDVTRSVSSMASRMLAAGVILAVLAGAAALLIIKKQLAPLDEFNKVIDTVGSLDLSENDDDMNLSSREDEFGHMSRSVQKMKQSLRDTVSVIMAQANGLKDLADALLLNTADLNETASQVDKAVNDIAKGATSQAQETQDANSAVISIGDQISAISGNVSDLGTISGGMTEAGQTADSVIKALNDINEKTRIAIADISESTKKTNASASEIKTAASLISDIAKQTNLLSLNASIEAARAGEHGRGFAVVAESIGDLANQSKDAAEKINDIIEKLVSDSGSSMQTMENVTAITEDQSDDIKKTSDSFALMSAGIKDSGSAVDKISDGTKEMDASKDAIIETLESLSSIAEENAAATEQCSASVTQMTSSMEGIKQQSSGVREAAEKLINEVGRFKL